MNFYKYSCRIEGLYFLHLLFYPKIQIEFKPEFIGKYAKRVYNTLELNVHDWEVVVEFREDSKTIFYMGLVVELRQKGFEIPFHNWLYEVGVKL